MLENSQETPTSWLLLISRVPFPWPEEEVICFLAGRQLGHPQPPEAARVPCHTTPHL